MASPLNSSTAYIVSQARKTLNVYQPADLPWTIAAWFVATTIIISAGALAVFGT